MATIVGPAEVGAVCGPKNGFPEQCLVLEVNDRGVATVLWLDKQLDELRPDYVVAERYGRVRLDEQQGIGRAVRWLWERASR